AQEGRRATASALRQTGGSVECPLDGRQCTRAAQGGVHWPAVKAAWPPRSSSDVMRSNHLMEFTSRAPTHHALAGSAPRRGRGARVGRRPDAGQLVVVLATCN
ncbi:unnamed protein product, partial [Polarella glacialis]